MLVAPGAAVPGKLSTKSTRLQRELDWQCSSKCFVYNSMADHFWKMRLAKRARDCRERGARFHTQKVKIERCKTLNAARTLVDLVKRSCFTGLQLAATKCMATAASRKAAQMLQGSCLAGLQLKVAKHTVLAARPEELGCRSYKGVS